MLRASTPIAGLRELGLSDQSRLRREEGGGIGVVYASPSSGVERTMSVPRKASLGSHDIEAIRTAFTQHFGAAVTQEALRSIDERLGQGKEIRGEHVRSAADMGERMFAEGFDLDLAQQTAADRLGRAQKRMAEAEQRLGTAETVLEEAGKRYDPESAVYGHWGGPSTTGAKAEVEVATRELASAKTELQQAQADLAQASARLDGFKAALSQPLERGQDRTRLAELHQKAKDEVGAWRTEAASAKATYDAALAEMVRQSAGGTGTSAEGLKKAREALDEARSENAGAQYQLAQAERALATVEGRIAALQLGPQHQRLQVALEHVGHDPRFADQLNRSEGLGTYAAKAMAKETAIWTAKFALAPLAWTSAFAGAISSEDQERRLGTATRAPTLQGTPLARGLAAGMAQHAEIEKYRQGIQGTVGFVLSGVSPVPHGGALGTVLAPVTNAASHAITHGAVSQGVSFGVGFGVGKAVGMPTGKAMNAALGTSIRDPGAVTLPVIPSMKAGKPVDLPLSDPKFAQPFLAFLGPAADRAMLADPDPEVRQREERRLEIRRDLFGTADTESLQPGKEDDQHDLNVRIVQELDRGEPGPAVAQASPLRVLYCGLGWLGDQTIKEKVQDLSQ